MAETKSSSPPPPSSSSSSSSSQWGPYNNGGDFTANMGILLVILFCSLLFALALNALIRYLLYSLRQQMNSESNQKSLTLELPASFPTSVFNLSTKLAGTVAECSICLAEFVDGDKVRVLPSCNHGFHVGCVEKWILTNKSCPTCRASYHLDAV